MNRRAIPVFALVMALCSACGGSSSQQASTTTPQPATHEHSSGAHHDPSDPEAYVLDGPDRDKWQKPKEVIELLECGQGMTVVDLGAGTGYFIGYLSEAVGAEGRVLALDTQRAMVDALYRRIEQEGLRNVRPGVVTPDDPALTPRSVDRVLVANVWHHLTDREQYGEKLLAGLRSGGLLLIVDFRLDSPEGPPLKMRVASDTVVRELDSAGFAVQVLEESLPYHYVIAGRVP